MALRQDVGHQLWDSLHQGGHRRCGHPVLPANQIKGDVASVGDGGVRELNIWLLPYYLGTTHDGGGDEGVLLVEENFQVDRLQAGLVDQLCETLNGD